MRVGKESEGTILEVWEGSRLLKEVAVPDKLHGKVYNDNWFGTGAAWDKDERCVAYVAEVPTYLPSPSSDLVTGRVASCLQLSS